MADADTSHLCSQIVHTHFGPLAAKVAEALLTRGRLPFYSLGRLTALKPRTLRACILALVQHHIVWHDKDGDEEIFEFNVVECLTRLRFGRFISIAEEVFGNAAAEIVQLILDHGKLQPPAVIERLASGDARKNKHYTKALYRLVSEKYLKPSTILSHHSPRDKHIKYEAEEKAKISGFPTSKQLREAQAEAQARFEREEAQAEGVGLKRKTKPKTKSKSSKNGDEEPEDEVDNDVYFRINYSKFATHIRNGLIIALVRERYNESAALVMQATLEATGSKQHNITDVRSDPTSVANISFQLSKDDDIATGLVLSSSAKNASNITFIKDYVGMLACADNPTAAGRAASFLSLISSKVHVEFETIGRRLRRRLLEAIAREKHGDPAVRILRLLLDTGKMDEKQIGKVAMMSAKDVRTLLAALSEDSFISLQEVPKSADRNPTRTFYLWYVDLQKAYQVILRSLYKTLYNIGVRRVTEQEDPEVAAVLEKRERTDVMSNEEKFLTRLEKETIEEWERKREMLTVLETRVEEAVFILRDLGTLGKEEE